MVRKKLISILFGLLILVLFALVFIFYRQHNNTTTITNSLGGLPYENSLYYVGPTNPKDTTTYDCYYGKYTCASFDRASNAQTIFDLCGWEKTSWVQVFDEDLDGVVCEDFDFEIEEYELLHS